MDVIVDFSGRELAREESNRSKRTELIRLLENP